MQTVIDRAIQHVHSRVQVSPRANGNDRMTFTGSNSNSSILLHPTSIVVVPTKSFDGFIDTDLPISPKGPRYEDCHYSYTTHKEGNCLDLHLPSKHSMKPVTLSLAKPADITLKPLKKPIKKEASWRKRCGTYLKNMYSHIHVMSPGKESNGSPKFLPRYLHNRPPGVCMYDLSELHDPKGLSRIACSTHPPGFMFGSVDAYVTENTGSSNDQGSFGIIRDYTEYGPNDSSFLSSGTSMSSRCSLDYNYGNKKCFLKVSGSMDEDKEIIYMEGPISGNIDSIVNMLPPIASVLTTPPLPKRMKSSNSVNELAVVDKPTRMPIPSKERQFSNTLTKQEFVFSKELNMIDHGGIPCSLTSHLQAVICLTKARFKGTDTSVQILLSFDEKMLQPTSRHVSYPLTVSFVILATLERLSTQWGKITVFVSAKESAAARARFVPDDVKDRAPRLSITFKYAQPRNNPENLEKDTYSIPHMYDARFPHWNNNYSNDTSNNQLISNILSRINGSSRDTHVQIEAMYKFGGVKGYNSAYSLKNNRESLDKDHEKSLVNSGMDSIEYTIPFILVE